VAASSNAQNMKEDIEMTLALIAIRKEKPMAESSSGQQGR